MRSFLTTALAFGATVLAAGRTSPPDGALVVGNGHYTTIQDAVNALKSVKEEQVIFIYPGTYREQVTVKSLPGPIKILGYTTDTSSYTANKVTITAGHSQKDKSSNDETATFRAESANFKLYNVNVVNSFGQGAQALALSANNGNQGYYGCSFTGFQDTVLSERGSQVFANCYIEGATDFIFGQSASAWFEKCTIGVLPASIGYITASGRASDTPSYYVFNRATIGAASGKSVGAGVYFLGRPWRSYARVAFQHSYIGNVVNKEGWHIWNKGNEQIDHIVFGEFDNKGPGAEGPRKYATPLKSEVLIGDILGSSYRSAYYFDSTYL